MVMSRLMEISFLLSIKILSHLVWLILIPKPIIDRILGFFAVRCFLRLNLISHNFSKGASIADHSLRTLYCRVLRTLNILFLVYSLLLLPKAVEQVLREHSRRLVRNISCVNLSPSWRSYSFNFSWRWTVHFAYLRSVQISACCASSTHDLLLAWLRGISQRRNGVFSTHWLHLLAYSGIAPLHYLFVSAAPDQRDLYWCLLIWAAHLGQAGRIMLLLQNLLAREHQMFGMVGVGSENVDISSWMALTS